MARRESDYSRPTVRRRGMRTGYTTGACAAAAAKAATLAAISGEMLSDVTISLPIGKEVTFDLHRCAIDTRQGSLYSATCSIIKDGGDDPDVTSGAEIVADVWSDGSAGNNVTLRGGVGVGTVTKPGTGIPVGDASITRVPRRMIAQSVLEAAGGLSFTVEISVPHGREIAKKTDNPRLGIVDGISILGTTGVVQPFSTAAWRASVNVSIDVAAANDIPHMVITTGTQSENFAKRVMELPDMSYVNVGIFTGAALKRCTQRGIPRATLVGMIGKFSKIAQGYFVTHVAGNKVDPVFLASLAAERGAPQDVQAEMRDAASGRHFQEIAVEHGVMPVFDLVCERVCDEAHKFLGDNADDLIVDAICFDFEGAILGKATTGAYIDIQDIQDG